MEKYNYNYHTHTKRCGHASGEDEEYVLAAIAAGIKELGISDHIPFRKYDSPTERMKVEELDSYIESVLYLKEKYKDQINIKVGLEVEYFIDDIDEIKEYVDKVDYAIIGQHYSQLPDGFDTYQPISDEEILEYANIVADGLNSKIFKYVAHPDLFMYMKSSWNETCEKATHIICEAAKRNHAELELNLGGIRRGKQSFEDGIRYRYPVEKFWNIVKEHDIDIVVGVDAHLPEHFLDEKAYKDLEEFIDEAGLHPKTEYIL